MKRMLMASAFAAVLAAVTLEAQTAAAKPGPEHKKLDIWVGDWTYELEAQTTPLGPGGKYTGKATVRSILGGFFVEFRGEETGPTGTIQWYEVDGYDAASKRYTWNGFGSDGFTSSVSYTIDGGTVAYSGTARSGDKQCRIRGTVVFDANFGSWVEKRELSADGQTWMPSFQSKFIKTKKAL